MDKRRYNQMMKGLIDTCTEKVTTGNSSRVEMLQLLSIIKDLEIFWNGDGRFSNTDYHSIASETIEKAKK